MAQYERDKGKERYWRGMLRQRQRSKQTIRAFCEEHGVSEALFYAWRRTIAERDQEAAARDEWPENLPDFLPVRITGSATPAPELEVVVGRGRMIRVPVGFDAGTLRNVLAILEEAPPC
jgi:transposase-like protein